MKRLRKIILIIPASIVLLFVLFPLVFPGDLEGISYSYNSDDVITEYGMNVVGDRCEFSINSRDLSGDTRSRVFNITMNPLAGKGLGDFMNNLSVSNPGLYNNKPAIYSNNLNINISFARREVNSSLDYNSLPNNVDDINNLISEYYREKIIDALTEPYFAPNVTGTGINFELEFKLSEKEEVRIYSTPERILFSYDHQDYIPRFPEVEISEDEFVDYLALVVKSLEDIEQPSFCSSVFIPQQGDAYNSLRYKTYEIPIFSCGPFSPDPAFYQKEFSNERLYPTTIVYDQSGIDKAIIDIANESVTLNGLEVDALDKALVSGASIEVFVSRYNPQKTNELFRGFIPEGKTQLEFFREYPKENLKWLVFGCHADSRYVLVYGGSEYPDGWVENIQNY